MSDLESNSKDRLVSAAKGVVGACPFIGSLAAEAIGSLIPNQRLDRVVEFLRQLEKEVRNLDIPSTAINESNQLTIICSFLNVWNFKLSRVSNSFLCLLWVFAMHIEIIVTPKN